MLKPAILATAALIFWIHLGSIINFHQHHIFGRTLMPQGILCKREDALKTGYDLPVCAESFFTSECSADKPIPEPAWIQLTVCCSVEVVLLPKSGIPLYHGLRAPPVA